MEQWQTLTGQKNCKTITFFWKGSFFLLLQPAFIENLHNKNEYYYVLYFTKHYGIKLQFLLVMPPNSNVINNYNPIFFLIRQWFLKRCQDSKEHYLIKLILFGIIFTKLYRIDIF